MNTGPAKLILAIMSRASSKLAYLTLHNFSSMKSLIEAPSGYDRWWISLNSPGCFFGTSPNGLHCKLYKGLSENGPAMRPSSNSFCNFCFTMSGLSLADFKHGASLGNLSPLYSSLKPCLKPFNKVSLAFLTL